MDWTSIPRIDTDRLLLRQITAEDVDALFTIFSHPEVMRYWSTPPLSDRDAANDLFLGIQEGFNKRTLLKWGIADRASNALIGTTTLINFDFDHRRTELGYALGRAHWGKGYIQEALTALLNYAFVELNFHRIEADVDPRNASSIRTLERLGFKREGLLRERWQVNGEIQDAYFYGLLRTDWDLIRTGSVNDRPDAQAEMRPANDT